MFGKKKRAPLPKGQGAAAAKQNIARMAEECMKEIYHDDEDDDDLEDDEDLLAELQEVVADEETEDDVTPTSPEETPRSPPQVSRAPPAVPGSLQNTLEERLTMYRTAEASAKASGESSKARRYNRGLQTLESMLVSLKKGRKVDEADIPPPVAGGAPTSTAPPPRRAPPPRPSVPEPTPPEQQGEPEAAAPAELLPVSPEAVSPSSEEELSSTATLATVSSTEEEETGQASTDEPTVGDATKAMLLGRQREYKVAALKAKQQGDMEQVKLYFRTSKRFDAVIEALDKGLEVDLSCLPPSLSTGVISALSGPEKETGPGQTSSPNPPASTPPAPSGPPAQPKDVLEALEQRRNRYQEACAQAKACGDDRKARMHERIAKQYQSAIRAHKAGRAVNYDELPVPPGFHPIPGQEGAGPEQGFAAVLEVANKLASEETTATGENEESKPPVPEKPKKPTLAVPPTTQRPKRSASPSADRTHQREGLVAAVGLCGGAQAAVPSPPGDEDEDFILVHHSDVQISEKAGEVYTQLAKILKEQYEKCMTYSKQFTHLGNITETTKFEKMAESCKTSLEMLKLSQSKGLDPPKHHFEERTYHTFNQSFTLNINRNHRGFRRAVIDGRKPTGGRVEVKVRLREPLSGQDLQTTTERWLVLDQSQMKHSHCPLMMMMDDDVVAGLFIVFQGSGGPTQSTRRWKNRRQDGRTKERTGTRTRRSESGVLVRLLGEDFQDVEDQLHDDGALAELTRPSVDDRDQSSVQVTQVMGGERLAVTTC
ncbi:unnamed protein product [Coregonus sp. 'balchen']|nr:unnamed protein product [Coregonus sp. 'balchen']